MPDTDSIKKTDLFRDRLEKTIRSFDASVPAAFARAVRSFLTAVDYNDAALMRSRWTEVGEALVDATDEAIQKRLVWTQGIKESYRDTLADSEGMPLGLDNLDELGREFKTNFDRALAVLNDIQQEVVGLFAIHKVEVPSAEQLRKEINELSAFRTDIVDNWPWIDRPLPPVDRQMVAESRAAFARGEGEPIEDVIRRTGGHP